MAGLFVATHGEALLQTFELTYVKINPARLVEMKLKDQFGAESRLRDETFRIVPDSDANFTNQTKDDTEGPYFWIVESEGEIIHRSSPGFTEQDWEMNQPTVKHALRNQ